VSQLEGVVRERAQMKGLEKNQQRAQTKGLEKNQQGAVEDRQRLAVGNGDDVSCLCGHGVDDRKHGRQPDLATARLGLAVHLVVASSDAAPRLGLGEGNTKGSPTMLMVAESFAWASPKLYGSFARHTW
jgi:hypothetical protein